MATSALSGISTTNTDANQGGAEIELVLAPEIRQPFQRRGWQNCARL